MSRGKAKRLLLLLLGQSLTIDRVNFLGFCSCYLLSHQTFDPCDKGCGSIDEREVGKGGYLEGLAFLSR
jgi:hypothetical protein